MVFFWPLVQQLVKYNKFEKLLCINPKPEVQFFSRTEPLCFTLVNEVINMVHGHTNLDVLDNCDLHPAQCLGCLFGQKIWVFFWGKINVFVVEILFYFIFSEILPNFQCQNMEKETMILMLNVSHNVYFCNFGYLLFFHFNKVW
jgi:hypothetical protein